MVTGICKASSAIIFLKTPLYWHQLSNTCCGINPGRAESASPIELNTSRTEWPSVTISRQILEFCQHSSTKIWKYKNSGFMSAWLRHLCFLHHTITGAYRRDPLNYETDVHIYENCSFAKPLSEAVESVVKPRPVSLLLVKECSSSVGPLLFNLKLCFPICHLRPT